MPEEKLIKFYNIIGPQVRRLRSLKKWSQNKLALRLQRAGLDVSRSDVAKIEARIRTVWDSELAFFVEVLEVELLELFPRQMETESAHDYMNRLMKKRY